MGGWTYHEALGPGFGRHCEHLVRKSAIGGRKKLRYGRSACSVLGRMTEAWW